MYNHRPNAFVRGARYIGVMSKPPLTRVVADATIDALSIVGLETVRATGRGVVNLTKRARKSVRRSSAGVNLRKAAIHIEPGTIAGEVAAAMVLGLATDGVRSASRRYAAKHRGAATGVYSPRYAWRARAQRRSHPAA